MGITNTLNAVHDYITTNYEEFSYGNCSVQSESIFNYLLSEDGTLLRGMIIGFGGTSVRDNQRSEFAGTLLTWNVNMTIFAALQGSDEDESAQILGTYALIDEIIDDFKDKPTLNGLLMDIVFDRIDEPMVYQRQTINNYLMTTIYWKVKENF